MDPTRFWPDPDTDTYFLERHLKRQGYGSIAGLDEVGRGPLAGPVVAACVVLPPGCDFHKYIDSKKISASARTRLYHDLDREGAVIGVGTVNETEIDRINILQASLLAMKKAVIALSSSPDFLLVDGTFPVPVPLPQQTLVKGESKSSSIAAASIVAKVVRDKMMEVYHRQFPEYNFIKNKGYPTTEHRQALAEIGPCPIHRKSFKGVREHYSSDVDVV